ncbi:MAG: AAA family ATPase, partial [Prevotellaceae bacterium]|nr:AAA family ATPase [Prevotellaceae bacterium]
MKNLPIGIQSFEKLRENDCLYVDKTGEIHQLVTSGVGVYFLSRPRRFGKSLLISTMDSLFSGRKDLFAGLYIYDKWDWTKQYPVIRIDWTLIGHATPEDIEKNLINYLKEKAEDYQATLKTDSAPDCLRKLIRTLHEKTGRRVVVLVDEYDVPILDVMGKAAEELKAIQEKLHAIYKVLKGADDHLQFVFLTGVSKFAGLSIFSALNNLKDITLDRQYATICGYTQQELEGNFSDYLAAAAEEMSKTHEELLDAVRRWYNGYSWDGRTSVYNPFGILLFLSEQKFKNFWFSTGTPTFLIELLKKRNHIDSFLQPIQVKESIFSSYDPERLETIPLLFQTGYLTIKGAVMDDVEWTYTLAIPNKEVEHSFV